MTRLYRRDCLIIYQLFRCKEAWLINIPRHFKKSSIKKLTTLRNKGKRYKMSKFSSNKNSIIRNELKKIF